MTNSNDIQPHSAEHFVESRDFWWNADFLELMAKRWRLDTVRTVLDVGCGVGHWGRALAPYLTRLEQLTGVDREATWVERAQKDARGPLAGRARYLQGDALALPFPDESFDMVTCQTLLIHLRDPRAAIREFRRVLKRGGLLAVVEPNNLAATTVRSNLSEFDPIDELVESVRFHALLQRGKTLLGEGDISLGDLVPGLFAAEGLEDLRVYLSDKASPLIPPYAGPEQNAIVQEFGDRYRREIWAWNRADSQRYFAAAGGSTSEFESAWTKAGANFRQLHEAFQEKRYASGGGCMSYLVSGRKR